MINKLIPTPKEARKEMGYAEFIKIEDGQTVIGKLLNIEPKDTAFGPSYFITLEIDGEERVFANKNKVVVAILNEFEKGTEISITRHGVLTKTKYIIVPTSGVGADGLPF